MSDSPNLSDRFDKSETKIRNRETCLKAGFTVSSFVNKAAGLQALRFSIVFAKPCDRLGNLKLYSFFEFEFVIDYALNFAVNESNY